MIDAFSTTGVAMALPGDATVEFAPAARPNNRLVVVSASQARVGHGPQLAVSVSSSRSEAGIALRR